MKYIFTITIAFLLLTNAPMPANAGACGSINTSAIQLSVHIPGLTKEGTPAGCYYFTGGLPYYIQGIYNFALRIGGFVAAILIMIGGARWVAAGGNSEKITKAKEQIMNAIVGLLLLLFSYTILNTINPALVNLKPIAGTDKQIQKPTVTSRTAQYVAQGADQKTAIGVALKDTYASSDAALEEVRNLYDSYGRTRNAEKLKALTDAVEKVQAERDLAQSLLNAYRAEPGTSQVFAPGEDPNQFVSSMTSKVTEAEKMLDCKKELSDSYAPFLTSVGQTFICR